MIDFSEEKGLFTFYREQAEQQQRLKQVKLLKKLQKKSKYQPTIPQQREIGKNNLGHVQSAILPKKAEQKSNEILKQKLKSKKLTNKKHNTDYAVIVVNKGNCEQNTHKYNKSQFDKKPLSVLLFDPAFIQNNQDNFSLPRSKIGNRSHHESIGKQKQYINIQQFKLNQFQAFGDEKFLHRSVNQGNKKNIPIQIIKIHGIQNVKTYLKKYEGEQNKKTRKHQSMRSSIQHSSKTQNMQKLPQIPQRKKNNNISFDSAHQVSASRIKIPSYDKQNFYIYSKIRKIQKPQSNHFTYKPKKSYIGGVLDISEQTNKSHIIASRGDGLSSNQNSKLLQLLKRIKLSER